MALTSAPEGNAVTDLTLEVPAVLALATDADGLSVLVGG